MNSKGIVYRKAMHVGKRVAKKKSSALTTEPKKSPPVRQKVIMVGDVNTGKTCLVHRYIHWQYDENHSAPTVGMLHTSVREGRTHPFGVCYNIWDTGGAEIYHSIMALHYRGADVVLLVYDVTSESTFAAIEQSWRKELLRHVPEVPVILVGNKCDLQDKRVIPTEAGEALARKRGYMFMETSAATGHNVDNLFQKTAFTLACRLQSSRHRELNDTTLSLHVWPADTQPEQTSGPCCLTS